MDLAVERPHFRALCRDSTAWVLPLDLAPGFVSAWTHGEAFWSGLDVWGARVHIKLGDIVGVVEKDAASLALQLEEADEERRRSLVSGE